MKLDTRLIKKGHSQVVGGCAAVGVALTASERYLVTRKEMFTFI